MATQLEVLRIVAPEFASVSDETVQGMLDLAPLFISPELYPVESRGLALVYQACILLLQRQSSESGTSGGGDLIREKEGDLERQFSSSQTKSNNHFGGASIYQNMLDRLSMNISMGVITRMFDIIPSI